MATPTSTATIAETFAEQIPADHDPELSRTLVRLLAEGEPLGAERVARAIGRPLDQTEWLLDELPLAYRDDGGNLVGYGGLAIGEMPHKLEVGGRSLFTWCAWDSLFLPLAIGEPARVESSCPETGERITLSVSAFGVEDLTPPTTVMSFLLPPAEGMESDVLRTFCHFVHFFASPEAAEAWTAKHENTFVLSIEESFELARFWAAAAFGVEVA